MNYTKQLDIVILNCYNNRMTKLKDNLFVLILLSPAGLIALWVLPYIDHVVSPSYDAWWSFPFFMTLVIIMVCGIGISVYSIVNLLNLINEE